MNTLEIFKKQGGVKLLKHYLMSNSLLTAIFEFALLGRSQKALEILRLSTELKTMRFLKRKYRKRIDKIKIQINTGEDTYLGSEKIWFCWFQGIDNAPSIVKMCYKSLCKCFKNKEIVIIDKNNYKNYVEFPLYVQDKVDRQIISPAHVSDLLRLELLIQYGGVWSDATVFYSSNNIPAYMTDTDLFVFQCLKPGLDGHSIGISNWYISAKPNNSILKMTRELLYEYWKEYNTAIDYYIFHYFFHISAEIYADEWKKVVPFSSATPHILLLHLFEQYDDEIWEAIKYETPIHKLTYKFSEEEKNIKGTFFDVLFGDFYENNFD